MQGPAHDVTVNVPVNADIPEGQQDAAHHELMLNEFDQLFLHANNEHYHRRLFLMSRQKEGEGLLAWHSRCRTLFMRGYPDLTADQVNASVDLRDHFMCNMRHAENGRATWLRQPATYQAALTEASMVEGASLTFDTRRGGGHKLLAIAGVRDGGRREGPSLDDVQCYNCEGWGHFQRDCRKTSKWMGQKRSGQGRVTKKGRDKGRDGRAERDSRPSQAGGSRWKNRKMQTKRDGRKRRFMAAMEEMIGALNGDDTETSGSEEDEDAAGEMSDESFHEEQDEEDSGN